MTNAYIDENSTRTLIASSSVDGKTPVRLWADPTTHRLLVDATGGIGGIGLVPLTATGTVNGSNLSFTFTQQPTYIVSDGVFYTALDSNSNTQWTWNAGTLTATMVIPPSTSIFGLANISSLSTIYADTVSGTINGINKTFTVTNTITYAIVLFLAGIPYQPTVDFTTSGTTITMTTAPDISLSGQPFWLSHI